MLDGTASLLRAVQAADAALPEWLGTVLFLGLTAFLAMFVHAAVLRVLQFILRGRLRAIGRGMLSRTAAATRFGLVVVALAAALQFTSLHGQARNLVEWVLLLAFIAFLGWTAVAVINEGAGIYMQHVPRESEDRLLARKHLTQVQLLRRIAVFGVSFVTFSAMLMTVPAVREYGMSLFASAGVAGLVIGLAARPVLSNLIAGVQLAVTQPIRIGDEVTVENEFGTVEEIRTSYVVLRLWDLRRMVVPLTYFMEKPFQNWTRESTSIIGRVLWYVDYTVPIDAMREAFLANVQASPLWDRQTAALQITDVTQEAVQVRGIMSAASSSAAFDLSCEIREKMILWLQGNNPQILPQIRTSAINGPDASGPVEGAAHH